MKILKEQKPTDALAGIADDLGKDIGEIERVWSEVLKASGKSEDSLSGADYGELIGKVKDKVGIKGDVDSDTSGKNTTESNSRVTDFLESTKSAREYLG